MRRLSELTYDEYKEVVKNSEKLTSECLDYAHNLMQDDAMDLMRVFEDIDSLEWNCGYPATYINIDSEDLPRFLDLLYCAIEDDNCGWFGGTYSEILNRQELSYLYVLLGLDDKVKELNKDVSVIIKMYGEYKENVVGEYEHYARILINAIEYKLDGLFFYYTNIDNAIDISYECIDEEDDEYDYFVDDDLNLIGDKEVSINRIHKALEDRFGEINELGCRCHNGEWLSLESIMETIESLAQ